MQCALLIIDVQNDYFPEGACELKEPDKAVEKLLPLLAEFREKAFPVIHIQHLSKQGSRPFLVEGTEGAEIHASVQPLENEAIIEKQFPNSFWQTALEETLHTMQVDTLVLTGMMTHMCVSATARAAMERGFKVIVVDDACTTRDLVFDGETIPADTVHKTALAEIASFVTFHKAAAVIGLKPSLK